MSDGILLVTPTTTTVSEDVGVVQVLVVRTSGSSGVATVDYATQSGTATSGSDFEPISGTFTWQDGESLSYPIDVLIKEDISFEPDETFTIVLSNPTGATIGASTATVTISSSDQAAGTVGFSSASLTISEDVGTLELSVNRVGGQDGEISVDYVTADETAIAGADYTAVSSTLTWLNTDTGTKKIVIPITQDTLYETAETFKVVLSNLVGGATMGTSEIQVTIDVSDQKAGALTFASNSTLVSEDVGLVTVPVERMGTGADGQVSATFTVVPGPGITSNDYALLTDPQTLTWNDQDARPRSIVINILDDDLYESVPETLTLLLTGTSGGASLGDITSFELSIDGPNDQVPGVISVSPTTYTVAESAGSVSVTLTRQGGSDGPVSVDVQTLNGQALSGVDFSAVPRTISWINGDASPKSYTVILENDEVFEPDEDFSVVLSNPLGGATLGDQSALVTIERSDQQGGTISFVQSLYQVEEDVGALLVDVVRTSPVADGAITVRITSVDDTAVGGADTTTGDFLTVDTDLTWGDKENGTKSVVLVIRNDDDFEATESFSISIARIDGGATLGGIASSQITIASNDLNAGYIAFAEDAGPCAACTVTVPEDIGSMQVTAYRFAGINSAVQVDYTLLSGTALSNSDFVAASGTLSWANNDVAGKSITIQIKDDPLYEPNTEHFTVILHNPIGVTLGVHDNVTVHIAGPTDQVPGTLQVVAASVETFEENLWVSLGVERVNGQDGPVSVSYALADGTATAGTDFLQNATLSGVLTWASGDTEIRWVRVRLVDDDVYETAELFQLRLSSPTGGAALGAATTTVVIQESDRKAGILKFANLPVHITVAEDYGVLRAVVSRVNGSDGAISVEVASVDGSAINGDDYAFPASVVLTWFDGDAADKEVEITIIDDNVYEPFDETFVVRLQNPSSGGVLAATNVDSVIAIEGPSDFVAGVIRFSPSSYIFGETDGVVSLTVERAVGQDGIVTVDYWTVSDTALVGEDYAATNGTITFVDGQTTRSLYITLLDDAHFEDLEAFTVMLGNVQGGATLDTSINRFAKVHITDTEDRQPGTLQISCNDFSTIEGTPAEVVVERVGGSDGAVSATLVAANGTAVPNVDYTPGVWALNWTDGDASPRVISIDVAADTDTQEATEIFYAVLDEPSGGATIGNSRAKVFILEGEPANVVTTGGATSGTDPTPIPTTTVHKKSAWEWLGPLLLILSILLCCGVIALAALVLLYQRQGGLVFTKAGAPVAVDRHAIRTATPPPADQPHAHPPSAWHRDAEDLLIDQHEEEQEQAAALASSFYSATASSASPASASLSPW